MNERKNDKIKCFYPVKRRDKPNVITVRHFIHSKKSGGLWAFVRDLSQQERQANDAVEHSTAVVIKVGYNPKLLANWEKIIIVDKNGVSYKLKEKPDEFTYAKTDLKFTAYAFKDGDKYEAEADEYE